MERKIVQFPPDRIQTPESRAWALLEHGFTLFESAGFEAALNELTARIEREGKQPQEELLIKTPLADAIRVRWEESPLRNIPTRVRHFPLRSDQLHIEHALKVGRVKRRPVTTGSQGEHGGKIVDFIRIGGIMRVGGPYSFSVFYQLGRENENGPLFLNTDDELVQPVMPLDWGKSEQVRSQLLSLYDNRPALF